MAGYATGDGGYAFGLEPDIKGPAPQPLTVMTALRLLDEVDALTPDQAAPMCRWLGENQAPDGGIQFWCDALGQLADSHPYEVESAVAFLEFHCAYDYAPEPQSHAARWFTEGEMALALDYLAATQQADGGWQISWPRWAPTTESEARPGVTIERLRVLRAWDSSI